MGNPAAAFLAGFAAVDQLETNRANRKFMAEKRSRLHTLLERQDDEYTRLKLERYRSQKLAEFDALVRDITTNMAPDSPGNFDGDVTDGKVTGRSWIFNEALKRMVSRDHEFGEHVAKAFGFDPASGPLVRDSTRPVSGVGILPAGLTRDGKGGVFWTINSVNGHQPMTENRSMSSRDKILMGKAGLHELVGVFGQGIMANDLLIAEQLRNAIGADKMDGNPVPSNSEQSTKPTEPTPEPEIAPPSDVDIQEAAEVTRNAQDFRAAGVDVDSLRREADEADAPLTARKVGEVARSEIGEFVDDLKPIVTKSQESAATVNKYGAAATESLKTALVDPVVDFYKGLLDVGEEETAPIIDKPVDTVAEITNGGGYAAEYVPTKIAKSEAAAEAVIEKGPNFASTEVAEATAERVLNTRGKPSLVDMYNAVGLAKLKVISPAQLTNYARTGQFDAAAKANLQLVTADGITTVVDMDRGVPVSRFQTGPREGTSQEDIFDLQSKYTKNKVIDWDTGKPSAAGHERLMTNLHAANRLLGFNAKQQSDRTNMDWMAKGQSYVDDFDPDTSQNLWGDGGADWNPFSDPKLGANALMFGYKAVQYGLENKTERDRFLNDYGIVVSNSLPHGTDLAKIVDQGETNVAAAIKAWTKETGAAPSPKQRAHIRTKTLEKLLSETFQQ